MEIQHKSRLTLEVTHLPFYFIAIKSILFFEEKRQTENKINIFYQIISIKKQDAVKHKDIVAAVPVTQRVRLRSLRCCLPRKRLSR